MITRLFSLAAISALAATAAYAEGEFLAMDADASGGLSLLELQAVMPNVSEDDFSRFDADASGELSVDEYGAWLAAKTGMEEDY